MLNGLRLSEGAYKDEIDNTDVGNTPHVLRKAFYKYFHVGQTQSVIQ